MLWPQRSDCALEYSSVPAAYLLPTYYLPPETQGLRSLHNSWVCVFHRYRYMVSVLKHVVEWTQNMSVCGHINDAFVCICVCGRIWVFSLNTMSRFSKAESFEWFIFAYIQPSVDCPLWREQSSWDTRCSGLWSQHPDLPNPSASLTRLASGRKGAARSLRFPGISSSFITVWEWWYHKEIVNKYCNNLAVTLADRFVCMWESWGGCQLITVPVIEDPKVT